MKLCKFNEFAKSVFSLGINYEFFQLIDLRNFASCILISLSIGISCDLSMGWERDLRNQWVLRNFMKFNNLIISEQS